MSDSKILVQLVEYESATFDSYSVYFDYDCLWRFEENGNLSLYKNIRDTNQGMEYLLATFPCGEWRFVRRMNEENNL